MRRLRRLGLELRGAWRLRLGFCPLCASSPPQPECPVCKGWRRYGGQLEDAVGDRWRERYALHLDREIA